MGLPVRPDHAIDAELSIIWEVAKVPSICPVLHCLTCTSEPPQSMEGSLKECVYALLACCDALQRRA